MAGFFGTKAGAQSEATIQEIGGAPPRSERKLSYTIHYAPQSAIDRIGKVTE